MKKEIDIDKLNRIFSGNYEEDDLKYIEELLLDDSNAEILEKYFYKYWNSLKNAQINENCNLSELLFKIQNRIDAYEKEKSNTLIVKLSNFYKNIAAVLVPIIIISSIFFVHNNRKIEVAEYIEIRTNKGSKTNFVLPDGTKGYLNSNSVIYFSSNFKKSRKVKLVGEAFFDVKHIKNCPLYVETGDIKIKVVGTRFNVKAYPEENKIETTLIKGKLEIEFPGFNSGKIYLNSNQKFIYDKTKIGKVQKTHLDREIKKDILKINEVENLAYDTAWTNNKLIFKNEPFNSLIVLLERWYNVEISLTDSSLMKYSYTGSFENETIEQALTALKLANPVFNYRIEKNRIEIFATNKIKD